MTHAEAIESMTWGESFAYALAESLYRRKGQTPHLVRLWSAVMKQALWSKTL